MSDGGALTQIAYASAATEPFPPDRLADLLRVARQKNAAAGVTGMLLYLNGSFFQVIEGPAPVVDALVGRISADPRHTKVRVLLQEPVAERTFGAWSMGLGRLDAEQLAGEDGLNDFFANGNSFFDLEPGRAKQLLVGFRGGRWRQAIEG